MARKHKATSIPHVTKSDGGFTVTVYIDGEEKKRHFETMEQVNSYLKGYGALDRRGYK